MFKELAPLLKKGDTLILSVSRQSDSKLTVTVTPRLFTLDGERGEDRKALNQPISVEGTIEELDSPEFAATLDRFTTSTSGLRQTIEDVEAAHKAAKETKLKKPAAPAGKPAAAGDKGKKADDAEEPETPKPAKKDPAAPSEVAAQLI